MEIAYGQVAQDYGSGVLILNSVSPQIFRICNVVVNHFRTHG